MSQPLYVVVLCAKAISGNTACGPPPWSEYRMFRPPWPARGTSSEGTGRPGLEKADAVAGTADDADQAGQEQCGQEGDGQLAPLLPRNISTIFMARDLHLSYAFCQRSNALRR